MTREEEERRQEEFNRKADKLAPEVAEIGCWGCLFGASAGAMLLFLPFVLRW